MIEKGLRATVSGREPHRVVDLDDRKRLRILLIDPHSLFRQAVRDALEHKGDLDVVGEGGTEVEMLVEANRKRPDVIIMAAELLEGAGAERRAPIRDRLHSSRVLVLSRDEGSETLLRAVEWGADGFLTKASGLSHLTSAIRAIAQGETVIPPRMLGGLLRQLLSRRRDDESAPHSLAQLTRREREVLVLLTQGANKGLIATTLNISPETARTHIQHVLEKLGVHSRLEAVTLAIHGGLGRELAGAGR